MSMRAFLLTSVQFALGSFFFVSPGEVIVESNELWQGKVSSCPKLHVNLTTAFGNSLSEHEEAEVSRILLKHVPSRMPTFHDF